MPQPERSGATESGETKMVTMLGQSIRFVEALAETLRDRSGFECRMREISPPALASEAHPHAGHNLDPKWSR